MVPSPACMRDGYFKGRDRRQKPSIQTAPRHDLGNLSVLAKSRRHKLLLATLVYRSYEFLVLLAITSFCCVNICGVLGGADR